MQISFTQGPNELLRTPRYHMLVLGGFDPSAGAGHQTPIQVTRGDFQRLLDQTAPEVALDIDNLLTGGDETWWIRLQPRSLKDFTPAGLIRLIPELDWIDALRRTIDDVAAGKRPATTLSGVLDDYGAIPRLADAIAVCRNALSEPQPGGGGKGAARKPTSTGGRQDDGLDSLFDMVATPDQGDRGAARDAVSGAIAAVTGRRDSKRPLPALSEATRQVTDLLQSQLGQILAHPRFIALEQAWRGLHWLLAGIGGDAPVDLQILPRDPDRLAEAIASARPTEAAEPAARFDLVLCDIAVGRDDLDLMHDLAAAGETAMTPVLVTLRADFFDDAIERPLALVGDPANLLGQPLFQRWSAACDDAPMRWLAACFNDTLLRAPYAAGDRHAAGISEGDDPMTHGLWGHAAWLVARRIAEQQQETDWPAPITGARDGRITDLLLFQSGEHEGRPHQRPLRHALSPDQSEDLGSVGIIALACAPNQDSAWITSAPSLLRIRPQADPEATRALRHDATLSAQLLRARLVHCVLSALDALPAGPTAERARALQHEVRGLIAATGASAQASAEVDAEHPDRMRLVIRLGERVSRGLSVELVLD